MRTSFRLLLGQAAKLAGAAGGGKQLKRILPWMHSVLHSLRWKSGKLRRLERRSASAGPAASPRCLGGIAPAGSADAGRSAADRTHAAPIKGPLAEAIELLGVRGLPAFDPAAAWPAWQRKAPPVGEGPFIFQEVLPANRGREATRSMSQAMPQAAVRLCW